MKYLSFIIHPTTLFRMRKKNDTKERQEMFKSTAVRKVTALHIPTMKNKGEQRENVLQKPRSRQNNLENSVTRQRWKIICQANSIRK